MHHNGRTPPRPLARTAVNVERSQSSGVVVSVVSKEGYFADTATIIT
jgi:hypothetical protein